ncbi:hypothetical protein HDU77_000473 [Chytriomyces hyalinus]|nr:hypothetical protein HDU77_000473 [Chytriomyces hyalinus]
MPRPNNKRNKCQKHSVKSRVDQNAAAAVPLVQATHQANAVHSIVPEVASFKPTSTQAVDASPSRVVLSQPSISVSDAECHVPQPPESLNNSASIAATTKRCVRTVVYNTWSGYSHVPRHLKEPLRFETNVVAAEGRCLVCFFAKADDPALSLPAENVTYAVDARKEDKVEPQELTQNSKNATLIASGAEVCGKAEVAKIVTPADENHMYDKLLLNCVAPPQDPSQQEQYTESTTPQANNVSLMKDPQVITPLIDNHTPKVLSTSLPSMQHLTQAKKVDETSPASTANFTSSCKSNALEKQARPPSPVAAQKEKLNNASASLPTSRTKVDQTTTTTSSATNTVTKRITPTHHATEQIKHQLVVADSAVDIRTLAMTHSAPKHKPNKGTKKQSRGQKRACIAKATKGMAVCQT